MRLDGGARDQSCRPSKDLGLDLKQDVEPLEVLRVED